MSSIDYGKLISDHYADQAAQHGHAPTSTMHDLIVRRREIESIETAVAYFVRSLRISSPCRLLELGCGNGYLLAHLRKQFSDLVLLGVDYSSEMVSLATARHIANCTIAKGDIRELPHESGSVDIAVTERCIINLMDRRDQACAFGEVGRVLRKGGLFICIEAFTDGLENLNKAKIELGLEPQSVPHHNRWIEKGEFLQAIHNVFEEVSSEERLANSIPPENFLSSHYFVSRVLYPAVTKAQILYNTAFVEFFACLQPRGNFSPIQLRLLKKVENTNGVGDCP